MSARIGTWRSGAIVCAIAIAILFGSRAQWMDKSERLEFSTSGSVPASTKQELYLPNFAAEASVLEEAPVGKPDGPKRAPVGSRVFSIPQQPVLIQFPDGELMEVAFRRAPPFYPVDLSAAATAGIDVTATGEQGVFRNYQLSERCLQELQGRLTAGPELVCKQDAAFYISERARWLARAVDAGNAHAVRLNVAEHANSALALDAFERAWRLGYIPPLGRIADLYFKGSPRLGISKDTQKSLAYLWLQAHLQLAAAGGGRELYVAEIFQKLEERRALVDAADFETAVLLAKELLRDNARCCIGP